MCPAPSDGVFLRKKNVVFPTSVGFSQQYEFPSRYALHYRSGVGCHARIVDGGAARHERSRGCTGESHGLETKNDSHATGPACAEGRAASGEEGPRIRLLAAGRGGGM